METKHTPGPWSIRTDQRTGDNGIVAVGTGVFAEAFADIRHAGEGARAEAAANARLIAAAPELLSAARRALVTLKAQGESVRPGNVLGALEAAIAKAGGRS